MKLYDLLDITDPDTEVAITQNSNGCFLLLFREKAKLALQAGLINQDIHMQGIAPDGVLVIELKEV
jgi:hypothetical protein